MHMDNQSLQRQLDKEQKKFLQLSEDSRRLALQESTLAKENSELKASLDSQSKEALRVEQDLRLQRQVHWEQMRFVFSHFST